MMTTSKGRPSKVSPELADRILDLIRQGKTRAQAAEESGIDRSSFFNWMAKGAAGDESYLDFFKKIKSEEARLKAMREMKRQEKKGIAGMKLKP